jgi:hypothetical protein
MHSLKKAAVPKFASSAQSGTFNHGHASQMAHAAALRQQAARALQGRPTERPPVTPGGASGVPGGAPGGPVAQVSQATGAPPAHVHAAIDGLVGQGKLTPFQGMALKAHQGPVKPAVVGMIAGALPKPPGAI